MAKNLIKKSSSNKTVKRGRPSKKITAQSIVSGESEEKSDVPSENQRRDHPKKNNAKTSVAKRPVGRPRKTDNIKTEIYKRPVGRPRKSDSVKTDMPKRPVGRPRKSDSVKTDMPKRPVGRPRKSDSVKTDMPKRPVGRPRKSDSAKADMSKHPVGRPVESGNESARSKSLTMNLKDVHALIEFVAKVGVSEVDLEAQGVKIVIKTTQGATIQTMLPPVQMAAPQIIATPAPVADSPKSATPTTPSTETSSTDESKYITINSPMIGTFYRKSSPDKPVFVNVGDSISPGKVLCIIEAMKLFNEIEAEITGKIVKVMVDDASPVEYDQPLFLVDPS